MIEHDHEYIKSLVPPYALGSLPDEEIRFVRAHILECEECMAEADDYFEVASSLSLAVPEADLPEGFTERVLAEATQERGRAVAPKRRQWRSWVPTFATGALFIAAIVLAAMVIDTRGDLAQNRKALAVLLQSDRGVELKGEGAAIAKVVPARDGSTLVAAGLPKLPDDRTYQLWFIRGDGDPVSAGVFDATDVLSIADIDLRFEDFTGAAVSIEPDGGSEEPTGKIVVSST